MTPIITRSSWSCAWITVGGDGITPHGGISINNGKASRFAGRGRLAVLPLLVVIFILLLFMVIGMVIILRLPFYPGNVVVIASRHLCHAVGPAVLLLSLHQIVITLTLVPVLCAGRTNWFLTGTSGFPLAACQACCVDSPPLGRRLALVVYKANLLGRRQGCGDQGHFGHIPL